MKTIGIIAAMHKELEPIIANLKTIEVKEYSKYNFTIAEFKELKIIATDCGIGKANASAAVQILVDKFDVDCIINSGVAGALCDTLNIFDIVIPYICTYHDIVPRFMKDYPPFKTEFYCDRVLIEHAKKACEKLNYINYEGLIVSGDAYIETSEARNRIIKQYSPLAVDMESAAIAVCAYRNNLPCLILRCISDNADEKSTISPDEFERIAANKSALALIEILNLIAD